jgi:hypothetical protein
MQRTRVALVLLALVGLVTVAAISSPAPGEPQPHVRTPAVVVGVPVGSATMPLATVGLDVLGRYLRAVEADEVGRYVVAVADAQRAAEHDAEIAAEAAAHPPVSAAATAPSGGGGHSDAWWHGVAGCEQGGLNDPYFGYFSFMDGSMGGQPWDVQVAAGNALLSRFAERESQGGAWADSCIDAAYRASPGG